jgi:tight adherence protein C
VSVAVVLPLLAAASAALAVVVARLPAHLGAGRQVARRLADVPVPVSVLAAAEVVGAVAEVGRMVEAGSGSVAGRRGQPVARVPRWLAGPVVVAAVVRRVAHRPVDARADARLGRALVLGGVVAVLHPVAGVVVGAAAWARPLLQARRDQRIRARAVLDGAVDVIDLVRLAAAAGLTVPLAIEAVASRATGPFGEALAEVRRRASLGVRWSEALEALLDLGEPARPLAASLVAAERDGAPLAWPLEQAAGDARLARRRAAEADARRLPVQLLFPLVLCTLPAFGLLTVVPLVVGTLGSLPG